jgi:hypothetical protein
MHARETARLIDQLKAELAADPTNSAALRSLVRLEVIPVMERDLAAEHAKPLPDPNRIAALTAEILQLHRGELPDHVRDNLLTQ